MTVAFNHTIIAARDKQESASFFTKLFDLPAPTFWGPFAIVTLADGVFVQFAEPGVAEIQMQHYAFLVDDSTFDAIYGRIVAAGIDHAGDPQGACRTRSTPTTAVGASTSAILRGMAWK